MVPDVVGKTFLIVGLARSGCAAGALLRRHGAYVIGIDDASQEAVCRRWETESLSELAPQAFDEILTDGRWPAQTPAAIVISPGVPPTHPRLHQYGPEVEILGEMELGARFCIAELVAITGTNGKSTTTEMIAHLLRCGGRNAHALGNVGRPLCLVADTLTADDVAVIEVSSFQLESVHQFQPRTGIVLNLAPDHQDRYENLSAYFLAKKVLADCVPPDGTFITATDCPEARSWKVSSQQVLFGDAADGAHVFYRDDQLHTSLNGDARALIPIDDLALQSPPNLLNALASTAVVQALGVDDNAIAEGLRTFTGLAHRHQIVARKGQVRFINDTKATNVHAVCSGLDGYRGTVVLIVGGSGKGEDYAPLREVLGSVRHVVTLGTAEGPVIGQALADCVPVSGAETMDEAVALAAQLAEPDAAVLLSPACASFDMFANYRARGDAFAASAVAAGAVATADHDPAGGGSE